MALKPEDLDFISNFSGFRQREHGERAGLPLVGGAASSDFGSEHSVRGQRGCADWIYRTGGVKRKWIAGGSDIQLQPKLVEFGNVGANGDTGCGDAGKRLSVDDNRY